MEIQEASEEVTGFNYVLGWSGTKSTISTPIYWFIIPALDDRW
jgi:hypothetical protein